MHKLQYIQSHYRTKQEQRKILSSIAPTYVFYAKLAYIVWKAAKLAQKEQYDSTAWIESSYQVLNKLEEAGIQIDVSNIDNIKQSDGPSVFIGNHMSMMETLVLPVVIQPIKPITYVIKESLLDYPIFKHVMRSRDPIAVTRTNPRQDLKIVMTEGLARLKDGMSVVVFPQTTRSHVFDPSSMSSIGVKLARKAGVPIVPLAIKTDCWQNGKRLKDFGLLDKSKIARFAFGNSLLVKNKGVREQTYVNTFIAQKLKRWGGEVLEK